MKYSQYSLLLLIFVFSTSLSFASGTTKNIGLSLDKLSCIKTSERGYDEIYLVINVLKPNGKHERHRIPAQHPLRLPIKSGQTLNKIPLLNESIKPDEKIIIIISLLESDLSKLNPDDLIGSAKLSLELSGSKLSQAWSVPGIDYSPNRINTEQGTVYEYHMHGDGGIYKLLFKVDSHVPKQPAKQ